jgi:hypothetical protein
MSFSHKETNANVAEKNTSASNIKAKSVIRVILGRQRSKKSQEIWQEYHESVKIAIRFLGSYISQPVNKTWCLALLAKPA